MSEIPDYLLGTMLDGRYEVAELIAEGGMYKAYKAVQRTLGPTVSVKFLKGFTDGASELQRRFFLQAASEQSSAKGIINNAISARRMGPVRVRVYVPPGPGDPGGSAIGVVVGTGLEQRIVHYSTVIITDAGS